MTKPKTYNIAIVGATGVVGAEFVKILEERKFPVGDLKLLASERSLGKTLNFQGKELPVETLTEKSFAQVDIALFSAGAAISKKFAPIAAETGVVVIDNTSQFRMEPDIPLVVPEVNPHRVADYQKRRIIANPNCSTIQLVVVLNALHKQAKIKRVVVSTYQSVSGAGLEAMEELSQQSVAILKVPGTFLQKKEGACNPLYTVTTPAKELKYSKRYQVPLAFNVIPHIDCFLADGTTKEEWKMMVETSKIMETDIPLSATTVRVPVFYGHSESVNVEFETPLSAEQARTILQKTEGVEVVDDPASNQYPLPIDCAGKDSIFVGRIREDKTVPHGLNMWIVADNVRKGAALNAVQIAELLCASY